MKASSSHKICVDPCIYHMTHVSKKISMYIWEFHIDPIHLGTFCMEMFDIQKAGHCKYLELAIIITLSQQRGAYLIIDLCKRLIG